MSEEDVLARGRGAVAHEPARQAHGIRRVAQRATRSHGERTATLNVKDAADVVHYPTEAVRGIGESEVAGAGLGQVGEVVVARDPAGDGQRIRQRNVDRAGRAREDVEFLRHRERSRGGKSAAAELDGISTDAERPGRRASQCARLNVNHTARSTEDISRIAEHQSSRPALDQRGDNVAADHAVEAQRRARDDLDAVHHLPQSHRTQGREACALDQQAVGRITAIEQDGVGRIAQGRVGGHGQNSLLNFDHRTGAAEVVGGAHGRAVVRQFQSPGASFDEAHRAGDLPAERQR